MDEKQPRAVTAGAEPFTEASNGGGFPTPPGPPHLDASPAPMPEADSLASRVVETPSDLSPPGPALVEMVPEPALDETPAAPFPAEPEPDQEPLFALEAERLTPPLVSSDTPLLAAPEAVVLDPPAPRDEEEASAPALAEAREAPTEAEFARPVPELEVASGAAAATVPGPLSEDAVHLLEEPLPDAALREPILSEYEAGEELEPEPEPVYESGPNWMLAFVTAWAGGTALFEAWALTAPTLRLSVVLSAAFLGYATLGLGMLGFAAEAIRPARGRAGARLALLVPALLTLVGIALLLLSHTPGRRI